MPPKQIALEEWDRLYDQLKATGLSEPSYGGKISRHLTDGDLRLTKLRFDNSIAALNLWNFLLTEEERLANARAEGKKLVGTMKDLGTVPVLAYSLPDLVAFYPDGAWWIPCVMELSAGLLGIADSLGIDESFCPVRAMLGAFVTEAHFPLPDLLTCSVGATCDDFSAIAQRLNGLGNPILWWEIPHRRKPAENERAVVLPGGMTAPGIQVDFVESELERIKKALESLAGQPLSDDMLRDGIARANAIRQRLSELRSLVFKAPVCPLPALELLIAEMLALHYCSDRDASLQVISDLLIETRARVDQGEGFLDAEAARIFWVNPVADLRVMNLVEDCGARICGTEHLFTHALDEIPTDVPPMRALAQMALADPMVGTAADRADRICSDITEFGAEALVLSRIPGASHCALEGGAIADIVAARLDLPVIEIEVAPLNDAYWPSLGTGLRALVETIRQRRGK